MNERFQRDTRTWAAYLLLGLFGYLETALGPAMPFLRAELGLGYTTASLHFSALASGIIVIGLIGERLVRRFGRNLSLWGGIAGMVAGGVLVALSPSVVGTILGALAMGFFGALSLMNNQAALSDLHGNLRTVALTESNLAATCCSILAPVLVGTLAANGLGWQWAFLLTVPWLLLLWGGYRQARFPESVPAAHDHHAGTTLPLAFWVLCLVLFVAAAVEWTMAYWGADFLASVVGLDRPLAASIMTLFFVAMAVGRLLGARMARSFASGVLLLTAMSIALVGFLLFWLATTPALNLLGLAIAGVGIANFYPLLVGMATGAAPHLIDLATARLAIAGGVALLVMPLVVGAIADVAGMRVGFGIVAPLIILALIGIVLAQRMLRADS